MLSPETRGRWAAALVVCAIFFVFAGDGIVGYFTPDDMMNLYKAWAASPTELLQQDRPVTQVVYRVMFAVSGLRPLPFRLVALVLLVANLALLYRFCLRLAGSREIAALACLLGAYHAHLADLYYSSGTYYDLLCWLFVLWFFNYYAGIRAQGRLPDVRQTAALVALYILALGSKEMAVMLLIYVPVYELLYQKAFVGWLRRGAWFWWLSLPLTAWCAAAKLAGAHAMTANPDYAPHFSAHAFFAGWRHYLDDLFYGAIEFNTTKIVVLFTAMLAMALYTRRREMIFGWVIAVTGALPVIFIPPRGFFVVYLTLPGWFLFTAATLVVARDTVLRRLPEWAAVFGARPEQLALFAVLALGLVPIERHEKPIGNSWVAANYQSVRAVIESLARGTPLRRGARVLFLEDPFDPGDWILSNMFRLSFHDETLRVDRVKEHPELAAAAATYDRVYVLDGKELRVISR